MVLYMQPFSVWWSAMATFFSWNHQQVYHSWSSKKWWFRMIWPENLGEIYCCMVFRIQRWDLPSLLVEPSCLPNPKPPGSKTTTLRRACLQKLSREDRFKVISEEFSQRQRLLFEKWMELPEVQQTQAAGRPQKRRKVGMFAGWNSTESRFSVGLWPVNVR